MALTATAWGEAMIGNPAEALELLDRAERISPEIQEPGSWPRRARMLTSRGASTTRPCPGREKALARNPRSTRALRILAMGLARLGEFDKAAEVIREVLAIEPGLTISKVRARMDFWRKAPGTGRLKPCASPVCPNSYVVPSFRTNPTTRTYYSNPVFSHGAATACLVCVSMSATLVSQRLLLLGVILP